MLSSGHINDLIERIPRMGKSTEIIFVEGNSTDDTYDVIKSTINLFPNLDIKLFKQYKEELKMVVNNKKVKRTKKTSEEQVGVLETKVENYKPKGEVTGNLFTNPMIESALKALSPEELSRYRALGEDLYGTVDFEQNKILNNTPAPMYEAGAYLREQLKSGLHPSMMDDDEKRLMEELFGKEWYKEWGYVEGDLTDIVTLFR